MGSSGEEVRQASSYPADACSSPACCRRIACTKGAQCNPAKSIRMVMDAEALISAALREAGYGADAIGSALPRIMRILDAEDVRVTVGRALSRKEREYVRVQLELGLSVSEVLAGLKR